MQKYSRELNTSRKVVRLTLYVNSIKNSHNYGKGLRLYDRLGHRGRHHPGIALDLANQFVLGTVLV